MRDSTLRGLARVLLGVGLLALVACGGGGGGGGDGGGGEEPDQSLYSGAYGHTEFAATISPNPNVNSLWGRVMSDGMGNCPFEGTVNDSTTVASVSSTTTYTVGAGRALTLSRSSVPLFTGRVSAAGDLAVFATQVDGRLPSVQVDIRRDGSHGDEDLMGGYHLCSLEYLWGSSTARGIVGDLDFNGSGTWTGSYTLNLEGAITPGVSFSAGAYQVQANGVTRISYDFGLTNEGQLRQGGDLLCVAGGTLDGSDLYVSVYVRESSGLTLAGFSGTYAVCGIEFDYRTGIREWAGVFGTLTADGAGGYTATLRRNMGGTVSAPYTETGTYSAGVAGGIRLVEDGGTVREGALSPDRTFGVYGGGTSSGSRPGLFVLLR